LEPGKIRIRDTSKKRVAIVKPTANLCIGNTSSCSQTGARSKYNEFSFTWVYFRLGFVVTGLWEETASKFLEGGHKIVEDLGVGLKWGGGGSSDYYTSYKTYSSLAVPRNSMVPYNLAYFAY
jgi:hypothetical protein